jgi:hypothetical protein
VSANSNPVELIVNVFSYQGQRLLIGGQSINLEPGDEAKQRRVQHTISQSSRSHKAYMLTGSSTQLEFADTP